MYIGDIGSNEVYIYTREDDLWVPQMSLSAPSGVEHFGSRVRFSGDLLAVGSRDINSDDEAECVVYTFEYRDGAYAELARVACGVYASSGQAGRNFDLDGSTLVVGTASAEVDGVPHAGRVTIYELADGAWQAVHEYVPPTPEENGYFGTIVSLYADDLAICEYFKSSNAHLATRTGGAWGGLTTLTTYYVMAVFMGDGLFVNKDTHGVNVYRRVGGAWTQVQALEEEGSTYCHSEFDYRDGLLVHGFWCEACYHIDYDHERGLVYVFRENEDGEFEIADEIWGHDRYADFGYGVATNGAMIAVGQKGSKRGTTTARGVFVFDDAGGDFPVLHATYTPDFHASLYFTDAAGAVITERFDFEVYQESHDAVAAAAFNARDGTYTVDGLQTDMNLFVGALVCTNEIVPPRDDLTHFAVRARPEPAYTMLLNVSALPAGEDVNVTVTVLDEAGASAEFEQPYLVFLQEDLCCGCDYDAATGQYTCDTRAYDCPGRTFVGMAHHYEKWPISYVMIDVV